MMCKKENTPIDFVIVWVDGNDADWKKEYLKYKAFDGDRTMVRFRDMGTLQYLFRGIEKYAPWVNKVYFITCGQKPKWLNLSHPKLVCVKHEDFMPKEYLPTFSSHAIEMNLHRIPGLSEHFVYFNDDMFVVNPVSKKDFFVNGLPCDSAVINYAVAREEPLNLVPYVNTAIINRHFIKKEVMRRQARKLYSWKNRKYLVKNIQFIIGKWFPGFKYFHLPSSLLKSTFEKIWEAEPEVLHNTGLHKFRVLTDVNQWLIQNWQICEGNFYPRDVKIGYYGSIDSEEALYRTAAMIKSRKYKLLCANDAGIEDFELLKIVLKEAFETILPDQSEYEC